MKRKLVTFAVFISLGFAAYGACNVGIEKAELAEADPIKIIVKPGKEALQKAIRKASGIEGAVIIEMDGGEYRTEQTIEISPGKWSSLLIRNKAGTTTCLSL